MNRRMAYKLFYILAIIIISILLIIPTIGEKKMEIVFNAETVQDEIKAVKNRFSSTDYIIEEKDKTLIIRGSNITDAIMNEIKIFKGVMDVQILKHWVEEKFLAKKINLGLDLQGGMHLVLRANYDRMQTTMNRILTDTDKTEITQQALEMLRNRIDRFGVSEPVIRPRGVEAIEIQLPGVKDPKKVKDALGVTGSLEYRFVDEKYSTDALNWMGQNFKDKQIPDDWGNQKELLSRMSSDIKLASDVELLFYYDRIKDSKKIIPTNPMAIIRKSALKGTDIQEAAVDRDDTGRIVVKFKTTSDGALKLAEATSDKNKGKRLAIILDNKIRNAPSINEPIPTGSGNISGGFSFQEAQTLARVIKEGALPVDLEIIEERTVGPSLGQDSIESGVLALKVSLACVMVFMLLYYKMAGLIANIGLILNFTFMIAILSLLGFTLTLPGIAAFVLTVGMAVDANVIIYERIKEELRSGKSVRMSVVAGFDRAFWAIFDSNLTTIIAAFILSQFGTGPIKGFAVSLFIGIISSMFVALYIIRFIYEIISLNKTIKKLSI